MQFVTLLNKKCEKNVFAFPPLYGFGLFYSKMAALISDCSFYSFDYISGKDKLAHYTGAIKSIQPDGPYMLLGYSAGGRLAYEVAKELRRQGDEVSGIIIIDTVLESYQSNKSKYANLFNPTLDSDKTFVSKACSIIKIICKTGIEFSIWFNRKMLFLVYYIKIFILLRKVFIKHVMDGKIYQYASFTSNDIDYSSKIDVDIYLLKSPQTSTKCIEGWSRLTVGRYIEYAAYGNHVDMISSGYIEKNAKILNEILDSA